MNEIKIFENDHFGTLRTVTKNGEPWFVASDVCKALDLDRTATRRLDADEKDVCSTHTPGGKQSISIVSESGLYSLILGSRKPEAHLFKRWVTHDVLPSIRKTGFYGTPEAVSRFLSDPQAMIALLHQVSSERSEAARVRSQLRIAEEKLQVATARLKKPPHHILFSPEDIDYSTLSSVADLARCISQDNHRKISRNQLYAYFRSLGYILPDAPFPSVKGFESGYFVIVEVRSGSSLRYRTAVTISGQLYFLATVEP